MSTKWLVDCPCGFEFKTPHGEDDAVATVQYHVARIHAKDYPVGISRQEALKDIKKVDVNPSSEYEEW